MAREFLSSLKTGNIVIKDVAGEPTGVKEDGTEFDLDAGRRTADVSPLTTKGDIWAYDTENVRLRIGDNYQVLHCDSVQKEGISWTSTPRFGDVAGGDYTETEANGSIVFHGAAGLAFAGIGVEDNTTQTTISSAGAKVQVTIFDTNNPSNNATPDHTNDHITIDKAGMYFISVSATVNSIAGAASRLQLTVEKNNGATHLTPLHGDRDIGGGGAESGSVSMSGIVDLAATDTVEVWIENETNTQNYVVEDIALSIVQLGGT